MTNENKSSKLAVETAGKRPKIKNIVRPDPPVPIEIKKPEPFKKQNNSNP